MRKAKQASGASATERKLEEVVNMLNSEAVERLLVNGDLTPSAIVSSLKALVAVTSDGSSSRMNTDRQDKLRYALQRSISDTSRHDRYLQPFGPEQVASSVSELRQLQENVNALTTSMTAVRRAARDLSDNTQTISINLINNLEQGVTPND